MSIEGLAVRVLGSGGPFVNAHRASSGYLVQLDGRPRLLVDAGGGTFERLGRAGVDPAAAGSHRWCSPPGWPAATTR
jgi:ribonuclease BN (tRNA processing enzyme)